MTSILQFFALFAFSQLAMALMLLVPAARRNSQVKLYALLMFAAMLYLLPSISTSFAHHHVIWWSTFFASNLLPGIFYLTALSVFSDHQRIKPWQYGFAVSPALILFISKLIVLANSTDIAELAFLLSIMKNSALLLDIGLACSALLIALKYWRNDLVHERRIIRGAVISVTASYIIMVIILGQVFKLNWPWLANVEMLLLVSLVTGLNFLLFAPKRNSLFEPPKKSTVSEPGAATISAEMVVLNKAMDIDNVYHQEGLTIAKLAKHINLQEYKLRSLINGQLGYRNFNDFLNHYRIREVSEKLAQTEYTTTPILTLALESGFRSLSSFNKAFKTTHGATPTEYRKNYAQMHNK